MNQARLGEAIDRAWLSGYFKAHPYRRWFDQGYGVVLNGAEASYYPGATSTALHTDMMGSLPCSPLQD